MNFKLTQKYFKHLNFQSRINQQKIKIIHLTGTKGKGSTAHYLDSYLRMSCNDVRTGLLTSPHVFSVRERIKINGENVCRNNFSEHFWEVYRNLEEYRHDQVNILPMPGYFAFLSLVSFSIFLEQKVNTIILEVGIGGLYDSTNVIENCDFAVFTPIHLDHCEILGNSVEEIARQKSGIIKDGSKVYSSGSQKNSVLEILKEKSEECRGCEFFKVTGDSRSHPSEALPKIPKVLIDNGHLAMTVGEAFLKDHFKIDKKISKIKLLKNTPNLPGRCQKISKEKMNIYLDGAHTVDSLEVCLNWFEESTKQNTHRNHQKIVIFNLTGHRDHKTFLSMIDKCLSRSKNPRNKIIFSSNITKSTGYNPELSNKTTSIDNQIFKVILHDQFWKSFSTVESDSCKSIEEAFQLVEKEAVSGGNIDLLVTGSLHLVSGVLQLI